MPRPLLKTQVLSCRVTPEVKAALVHAAKVERRSIAGMLEVMVLDWCDKRALKAKSTGGKK